MTLRLLQFSQPVLDLWCARRCLSGSKASDLGISNRICPEFSVEESTKVLVKSAREGAARFLDDFNTTSDSGEEDSSEYMMVKRKSKLGSY